MKERTTACLVSWSRNLLMEEINYVMLCYVMLCYVMLCYVMLCYAKDITEMVIYR